MPPRVDLASFPRPNVAVDIAVLTVVPDEASARDTLAVLVQRRDDEPRGGVLPGRFLRERHTIEQTVQEVLEIKLGIQPGRVSPTLLRAFSAPDRDARAWTISIAHAVTLPVDLLDGVEGDLVAAASDGSLVPGEHLLFDHDKIVVEAITRIRERYESSPDPDGLMPDEFTLAELRRRHEAVLGEGLRKDTFNRRMKPHLVGLTAKDGSEVTRTSIGRPAQLFRKAAVDGVASRERWRLPRQS